MNVKKVSPTLEYTAYLRERPGFLLKSFLAAMRMGNCISWMFYGDTRGCSLCVWGEMSGKDGSYESMVDILSTTKLWKSKPENDYSLEEVIESLS